MGLQREGFITASTTTPQRTRRDGDRGALADRFLQDRFLVEGRFGGKAAPVSFRCQEETSNATTARSRRARCGLVVFAVMSLSTRVNRAGERSGS